MAGGSDLHVAPRNCPLRGNFPNRGICVSVPQMGGTQCALATAGPLVSGDPGGPVWQWCGHLFLLAPLDFLAQVGMFAIRCLSWVQLVRNVFRAPVVTSWTTIDLDKVGKRSLQSRSVGQGRVAFSKPKKPEPGHRSATACPEMVVLWNSALGTRAQVSQCLRLHGGWWRSNWCDEFRGICPALSMLSSFHFESWDWLKVEFPPII